MTVLIQLILAAIAIRCWTEAGRDPIIVRHAVRLAPSRSPIHRTTIAFITDTHVSGDFAGSRIDPEHLSAIVAQVNALHPDAVVLGGDYITGKTGPNNPVSFEDSVAPFRELHAPKGVYGVLGNHDYERGDDREKLAGWLGKAGVVPLVNATIDLGDFVLAGVDDLWFGRPDPKMMAKLSESAKPVFLVSHNPDIFPSVPSSVTLTLAGHTHGAQIVPPLIGPIVSTSAYGQLYRRGLINEDGHHMIVSSGIGGRPFRWNVPPEIVMITID